MHIAVQDPQEMAIHEMVHLGIEDEIVQKFRLTHKEKERLVDRLCMKQFTNLLPAYTLKRVSLQDEHAETLDTYLLKEGAMRWLPGTIEHYVKGHPR